MRGLLMRIWHTITHRSTAPAGRVNGQIRASQREIDELAARLRAYEERVWIEDRLDRGSAGP